MTTIEEWQTYYEIMPYDQLKKEMNAINTLSDKVQDEFELKTLCKIITGVFLIKDAEQDEYKKSLMENIELVPPEEEITCYNCKKDKPETECFGHLCKDCAEGG